MKRAGTRNICFLLGLINPFFKFIEPYAVLCSQIVYEHLTGVYSMIWLVFPTFVALSSQMFHIFGTLHYVVHCTFKFVFVVVYLKNGTWDISSWSWEWTNFEILKFSLVVNNRTQHEAPGNKRPCLWPLFPRASGWRLLVCSWILKCRNWPIGN